MVVRLYVQKGQTGLKFPAGLFVSLDSKVFHFHILLLFLQV